LKKALKGATKPRLQNAPLKGKSRLPEVKKFLDDLNLKLLPWQEYVLKDLLAVDKSGKWRRKTIVVVSSAAEWKDTSSTNTHIGRVVCF
jgi:hypothetical protein